MINRPQYLKELLSFKDSNIIKVVTGVRRCGKSTLFDLYKAELLKQGITEKQIQIIKLEEFENEKLLDYRQLHQYVMDNLVKDKQNYVFLDEIQNVPDFQKAVRSLFEKPNIDLYLTGSNSRLQSGQWATSLAGRYVEIKMFPLSFKEFSTTYSETALQNLDKIYKDYLTYSSFPYALFFVQHNSPDVLKQINTYIEGIFDTIILRDVMENSGISEESRLRRVIKFMASCVGSEVSMKKISDVMTEDGTKILPQTIENYIDGFKNAHILYQADRYDVKGKKILKTLNKFYFVDMGIRQYLLGNTDKDSGHVLENIVYLELLRRGYKVYVGKVDIKDKDGKFKSLEIDFIAENSNGVEYYQVANSVLDENVLKRELASLDAVRNHYPKYILTRDYGTADYNGIKKLNVLEWLMRSEN
ncbi:MAG: ATP-binding protein [Alphaproteobacteria bacterium]|nr:ATP-binding protein [Alphaproteobacteria bacterium]